MDRSILNKYKNQEERLILSKIIDKIDFCEKRNQIQVTNFFDLSKQELISKFLQYQKINNAFFYGGYEQAERKALIIYPEKYEELIKENKISLEDWIKVIKITLPNDNIGEYKHQNYLGGLIKLGLNREKIGDIVVDEKGADIIINNDIENFLLNNLNSLTRFQKAKVESIKIYEIRQVEIKTEIIKITVSSMRLDNIIAELVGCSRNKASQILMSERVFVNYENVTKPTKEIKENDKITIRGKGRFKINKIIGNTKKDRIILEVEK